MRIAITRGVSPAIADCQLTHLARHPIDYERARVQHSAYEAALAALGCQVQALPAEPAMPDSVFVEDLAIVLDEVAILTRPGAVSRRAETASVATALTPFRPLVSIDAPATLDGGDVLRTGRMLSVGLTTRTNQAAVDQLTTVLAPYGYRVQGVPVRGCLHLKSAVTEVAPGTLLGNGQWIDWRAFAGFDVIEVDAAEPYAANGLRIGERVIYPAGFPATAGRLAQHGVALLALDVSELQKAEGAVTCCSLVFESPPRP